MLKDLSPLEARAEEDGFGFLSYLLRMAILEAQAIASGSNEETEKRIYESDDSTYDCNPPDCAAS